MKEGDKMLTPIEERQKLIVYIRANLKRYANRTGDRADKDFILELQELLEKYDLNHIDGGN
jgi:hypothetical protein